jgi:hypothetical protein
MWKCTVSARAAENSRTGNETSPKLMKPFQTVAGIVNSFFRRRDRLWVRPSWCASGDQLPAICVLDLLPLGLL